MDFLDRANTIFDRNGTLQKMSDVSSYLGQSKSDNVLDRIQGLTGLVAKILGLIAG